MSSFPSNDPSRDNKKKKPMSGEAVIHSIFTLKKPMSGEAAISAIFSLIHLRSMSRKKDDVCKNPLYKAECQKMETAAYELKQSLGKGILCGIGTLALMRRQVGPRLRLIGYNSMMRMRQQLSSLRTRNTMNGSSSGSGSGRGSGRGRGRGNGGYTFDKLNHRTNIPSSSGKAEETPKPGILFRMFEFGVHLYISAKVTQYVASYFYDGKKVSREWRKIPLVEGKSATSDRLCDDYINVYRRIPKKVWDKYESDDDGVLDLKSIGLFVRNCYRRRTREKELRDEKRAFGGAEDDDEDEDEDDVHPPIPPPGVSPDIEVEIEWIVNDKNHYFNNDSKDDDDHSKN